MKPADFDIHRLIESLQGTCETLSGKIEDMYEGMTEDDLTSSDHDIIDNEIFLCAECGWWCEISESAEDDGGEQMCTDCRPGDDDD